jgi:hypothetical protein
VKSQTNGKDERSYDDHTDTAGNDRGEDDDGKNKEGYANHLSYGRTIL